MAVASLSQPVGSLPARAALGSLVPVLLHLRALRLLSTVLARLVVRLRGACRPGVRSRKLTTEHCGILDVVGARVATIVSVVVVARPLVGRTTIRHAAATSSPSCAVLGHVAVLVAPVALHGASRTALMVRALEGLVAGLPAGEAVTGLAADTSTAAASRAPAVIEGAVATSTWRFVVCATSGARVAGRGGDGIVLLAGVAPVRLHGTVATIQAG